MRQIIVALAAGAVLLIVPAAAQDQDAMSRWGKATLDRLAPFLPDASPWGLTPESETPSADFKAFANDTPHRYYALVTHKTWWFGDPALFRELEEVRKAKQASKEETKTSIDHFMNVHGAELTALNKAHLAEMDAASKQAEELFRQGKYEEGKAVIGKIRPVHFAPLESLTASLDKREQDLDQRERDLLSRRRNVRFLIYTNRTPSTTAFAAAAKPAGTLAGRTLYLQDRGTTKMGGDRVESLVDFAIFLGPANFQNAHVKLGESELRVKCIVVWAWIESRPDAIQADEATVKKVLEKVDYEGLAKLIDH